MKFTKMQGTGNDYIYVDCFKEKVDRPSDAAIRLSDRHFGIGADGLILIKPSVRADFTMEMYNADGSRGEMCGNGIRCLGKYVYDYGLTDKKQITVETPAGIKTLDLTVTDGKVSLVRVDMGAPILRPEQIPVAVERNKDMVLAEPITIDRTEYRITCVSMGNPHAVVFVDDLDALNLENTGPKFEHHPRFPKRINTEFARVIDRKTIKMRVFERGSGETLACGTGACAVAVAGVLNGLTRDTVTVELQGGDLLIEWDRGADVVYMTGPAAVSFEGEFFHQF